MTTDAAYRRCLDESGQPTDIAAEVRARQRAIAGLTTADLIGRLTEAEPPHPAIVIGSGDR